MKKVIITFAILVVSLLNTKSFAQTANLNITISDVLSFSVTQPASLDVNFNTETKYTNGITYGSAVTLPVTGGAAATVITAANTSWSGSNATNKFNISYQIGAGGAYAGKATGLNVVPVVYTVTQQ